MEQEDIKIMIAESLYKNNLINDELYEKCGKPHISSLPGDLRTNDPVKLQQRKDAIIDKWNEIDNEIISKNYPEEFWNISEDKGEFIYDEETGSRELYDGQKVVDYYDNLLNTKNELNDMIRERYDSQIDDLTKENTARRKIIDDFAEKWHESQSEYAQTEHKISDIDKELSKINRELRSLEKESDRRDALQAKLDDGYAIIDEFLKANGLESSILDGVDQNPDYRRRVNEQYNGLGDYALSIMEIEAELDDFKESEYYNNNIMKLRDNRNSKESDKRNLQRSLPDIQNNIDYYFRAADGSQRVYDNVQRRIKELKQSKPNKNQRDNESYQELVDKKNLAIEFKNDINKAHDYQSELTKVNERLGYDADNVWDGLPISWDYQFGNGY